MNKYIGIIIILFVCFSGCLRVERQFDEEGELISECQVTWPRGTKCGWCKRYDDGKALLIQNYRDDKLSGDVIWYYENGKKKKHLMYNNDRLWNVVYVYDHDGNIKEWGSFKNGNGTLRIYVGTRDYVEGTMVDGYKEGYWKWYDRNGEVIGSFYFENNVNVDQPLLEFNL